MLPLNLVFFTSTSGHFGFDTYQTTIKHFKKKLNGNFDLFNKVYAHIKVKPNHKERLQPILDFLESEKIEPIVTEGDWERGLIHGWQYLKDQFKVYNTQELHDVQYLMVVEDDSPILLKEGNLSQFIKNAIYTLDSNRDVLHIRFQREGALNITYKLDDNYNIVDTYDFQPYIARVRDLMFITKILLENEKQLANVQCEMAFRIIADMFSSSYQRYLCFNPSKATSYHIGAPNYLELIKDKDFSDL